MLNFNHVYYFHVAATEGSVKGAADRLGVTQPTVSEQIKQLERALGVILFERSTSGLRLTERGREAYEHTTSMFRAGERLVAALGTPPLPPPVQLRVGLSAAVARTVAADFLMPVLAMPDCKPVIRTGDLLDILRDLRSHELDLAVCENEPMDAEQRGLVCVALHRPTIVAIASPDITPVADWNNLSMLEHRQNSSFRWEVDAYLESNRLRPRGVAELDDAFLMLEAVARGGFVAFVPKSVAHDAIATGRVRILASIDAGHVAVYAVYHGSDSHDLARRAVEQLAEEARRRFAV